MENNKKRRKKKTVRLSAINTRIHRENRAQPPPQATVFNSVFGISKEEEEEEQVVVRAAAANET